MSKPKLPMDVIRSAAEAGAIRSEIGRWFAANHDEFADTLRRYRPRWEVLIEQFAKARLIELPADFSAEDALTRQAARRRVTDSVRKAWQRAHKRAVQKTETDKDPPRGSVPSIPALPTAQPEPVQDEPEFTTLRGRKL